MARRGRPDEVQDRRHQIDLLHDVGHARAGAGVALLFDDERHANRFVVDEQAVFLLAVIAETLAVIGQQHDGGAIVQLVRLQIVDQSPDDFVGVGDLAVVG